ncbi:class I SAM-dependent methyltransferase [Nibricoccus sp. IMCC34717]|uniref:class I SAM-dependent methyltransferase n=1 Tax=Nibricoccus sp. IMCC34717 TaxID=3034021 RepID=UPI00384F333E
MNRDLTNAIRYVMDEWLPPAIRDSRWFMYPFFHYAYRGKNIAEVMDFKRRVLTFTQEEYERFYNSIDSISRHRATDLNRQCIELILDEVGRDAGSVIDVGCGGGYLLRRIRERHPGLALTGLDVKQPKDAPFQWVQGNIEKLPFPDASFDVTLCCHTIEHLPRLDRCLAELARITRKKLILVTPCQRYFYYTLDEHVNFFPFAETLTSRIPLRIESCRKVNGDWYCVCTK